MKKIICGGRDGYFITDKEADNFKTLSHERITFLGEFVEVQIPFADNNCVNWNEYSNFQEYVGIIYKGMCVSYKQLLYILNTIKNKSDCLSKFGEAVITFDGKEVVAKEIEELLDFIYTNIDFTFNGRNVKKTLRHYTE